LQPRGIFAVRFTWNDGERVMRDSVHNLRFGVLGTGRITRKLGPAIARTAGTELAAVGSRDAARAAAWAASHGASRSYGSYDALLNDPDLDAVYIALPPALHCEWTVKAAERGLHVLCEKPLAAMLDDAVAMAAACREHKVQLMDGVMWVHTPRAAMMRAVLESGDLGEIQRVTSAFTFRAEGWDRNEFRLAPDMGGGSLLDLGWYCVGVSLWAFAPGGGRSGETGDRDGLRGGDGERGRGGEYERSDLPLAPSPPLPLPASVIASADWREGVDHTFSAALDFGGGRIASFDCGFTMAMRKWVEIAGTHGSLVCDDFTRPWSPDKVRFWVHGDFGKATEHRSEPFSQEDCLVAAFCECARTGPDHSWGEKAVAVQRVCDDLRKAALTS
jgi:predicted dehydrogenase